MPDVQINPHARFLGRENAVLSGRGRRYDVRRFSGPLSMKSIVRGRATWATSSGTFDIEPGCALVVNSGEEYDITIDALQPVETFCVFFRRGFVEDAYRSATSSSADLIDASPVDRQIEVDGRVIFDPALIRHMRVDSVAELASALVRIVTNVDARGESVAVSLPPDLLRDLRQDAASLHPAHAPRARAGAPARRTQRDRGGAGVRIRERRLVHHAVREDVRRDAGAVTYAWRRSAWRSCRRSRMSST